MKLSILVVDDEVGVRELLTDALTMSGYEVLQSENGLTALEKIKNYKPNLLIIDVNMPMMNGFELVENLRETGNRTPVLMLSARTDQFDINRGLRIGADDYVTKPFGLEELTLRVKAILKRSNNFDKDDRILNCGPIKINTEKYQVTFNDQLIELSPTEYRLLILLVENKSKVLTKNTLLSEVWGIDFESETTVIDTYISYLRKKLHRDGYQGIKTVRGIGFVIED
ncbi:MAG: hypothetical protein RL301_728 [Actinomycetota bacterium]|jgi:two-component system OmpR family response regulator